MNEAVQKGDAGFFFLNLPQNVLYNFLRHLVMNDRVQEYTRLLLED